MYFEKLPLKIHLRILWKTLKTMAITFVIFWIIFHYTIGVRAGRNHARTAQRMEPMAHGTQRR